jgi:tetratricopeptide (TPR) repeat protein
MAEHFQRYTAPDPEKLAQDIERARRDLSEARANRSALAIIEHAGDLAGMLTTHRQESEARDLLAPLQSTVREHLSSEPAGWYYLAFGTASQYLGFRDEANAMFAEALRLAREHSWEVLEHFALSHWGRSLVEEGNFSRARECFLQALAIRERLDEPRAASSRRHLAALSELEASMKLESQSGAGK